MVFMGKTGDVRRHNASPLEVISLGGSLVVHDQIATSFLKMFKQLLRTFTDRKFVVVVGGGKTARVYMEGLEQAGFDYRTQAHVGFSITRFNALLVSTFLGANKTIPSSLPEVKNLLRRHRFVVTGGLRFERETTTDGTAAEVARYFRTHCFINMTNVKGLYDKDPRVHQDAQLIPQMAIERFHRFATQKKYKPGQHFVLDQHAAALIRNNKIKTYIVSGNLKNLRYLLRGQSFVGTVIS